MPLMKLLQDSSCLQAIINSVADGIVVADKNGSLLSFNQAAERILGIGSKEIAMADWSSVYGCYQSDKKTPYLPEQLPLARALRGEQVNKELIFIRNPLRPEGLWINISASPIINKNDNSISGATAVFKDITETRQVQKDLEIFARAVEQTADSVVITDRHGVIEYVNPAFEETSGYSKEEALGQTPRILKSKKHNKSFYSKLWKKIMSGDHYRGTIINKKKNGELYNSEQTITPMKDHNGNITHFVSVLKNITGLLKQKEQEIRMQIAREIQQQLNAVVSMPNFDIAGKTYSADETSGDYYDFIKLPDGSVWIAVGDVTGHGIGAALIMASTRAYLRAFIKTESSPANVLHRLNQELVADLDKERFVTLILARLDPQKSSLVYANAGHVPGYLLNSFCKVEYELESTGVPLGFLENCPITQRGPIKLSPESLMVFLTDGILEAQSPAGKQFGFSRIPDILKCRTQSTAEQMIDLLYQEVQSFTKHRPQEDDITFVICKVNPIH
jgi:phosphoserine phosphatase RsbU/P